MAFIRYITHPEVALDFTRPVAEWGLSEAGRERAARMLSQPWVADIRRVISSPERKAVETAAVLAAHLQRKPELRAATGENDRTATGPLPPAEFEALADQFFARPEHSIRGWERAVDAQSRITEALSDLIGPAHGEDVAVIGHGGVGTLWYCRLAALAIDRRHDQPAQGHYFTVDRATGQPLHGWRPIDAL